MISLLTMAIFNNINQNQIENTCNFEKIRIPKEDIKCIDAGQYTKYCKHYSLPNEFIVTKEKGIGNNDNIIIKPEGIFTETDNNKEKIAEFTYKFQCYEFINPEGLSFANGPFLQLIIYPKDDSNPIWSLLILILIIFLMFILSGYCDLLDEGRTNNDFRWGYILGSSNGQHSRRRTYCE